MYTDRPFAPDVESVATDILPVPSIEVLPTVRPFAIVAPVEFTCSELLLKAIVVPPVFVCNEDADCKVKPLGVTL